MWFELTKIGAILNFKAKNYQNLVFLNRLLSSSFFLNYLLHFYIKSIKFNKFKIREYKIEFNSVCMYLLIPSWKPEKIFIFIIVNIYPLILILVRSIMTPFDAFSNFCLSQAKYLTVTSFLNDLQSVFNFFYFQILINLKTERFESFRRNRTALTWVRVIIKLPVVSKLYKI